MNEIRCATSNSTTDSMDRETSTVFVSGGKGLQYDWRAVMAAAEAADLDSELAQLEVASTRS